MVVLTTRRKTCHLIGQCLQCRWMVQHLATCPMTASLSQMLAAVGFAHLMSPPVWSRALTQASVTGPSKSLDPDSGTVCRLHCVSQTRQSASSRNCWRLICLAETAANLVTVAFIAPCTNISTTTTTNASRGLSATAEFLVNKDYTDWYHFYVIFSCQMTTTMLIIFSFRNRLFSEISGNIIIPFCIVLSQCSTL